MRYRVLSPWTIAAWAVLIVLVGAGVAVWLLLGFTGGNADANRVQLDAIRTAGTIVVGIGGAAALLLAARRQRSAEIALKQKDRDQADVARAHALQERTALASEADTAARRITDLYAKAADQLGSEKAPVRLAGLYALERLAQDHPSQRRTIVNVFCAYLRMPYTLPGDPPADTADDVVLAIYRERVQEREVRLAVQGILAHHLRAGGDPDNPVETFWANFDLDLTGATLTNFRLDRCNVQNIRCIQATFTGTASFNMATFTGDARFALASFTGDARFSMATFTGIAAFSDATFTEYAGFDQTTFAGDTSFFSATFKNYADFSRATFTNFVGFGDATLPSTRADYDHPPWTDLSGTRIPHGAPWTDFAGAQFVRGAPAEVVRYMTPSDDVGDEGEIPRHGKQ